MPLHAAEDLAAIYAAVIESALDSVIVVDESGHVVALNPAAVATFGFTPAEAVGQDIGQLIVPPQMRDRHRAGMERYRATGDPHVLGRRVEMEACHRDGHLIPVELAITEVRLPGGRHFTANLRDLRPARAAAREIARQRDALHQSEKLAAVGSLLAGVAHELNNPLGIALGQASLLVSDVEAEGAPHELADRARRIHDAALRCAKVVRSFLSIVRHRPPRHRSVDLAGLVAGSVDLLAHPIRTAGVDLSIDMPKPAPMIEADPDQVQQILVNLIVNAVQAMETAPAPRRLHIAAETGEDVVRLVVSDSGPGVPADLAQRIFEPFFSTKPDGIGTGIGLPVSRRLAEAQGGALALLPSDTGAVFAVSLRPGTSSEATPEPRPPAVRPLRLLVVDDEPGIAAMLAEGLAREGHDCTTAGGGRAAMEAIGAGRFDAVVCDLRMPDIDGPALHDWMERAHPDLAAATIFMTGDALGQVASRFLASSGRAVLEKPFAPEDLRPYLAALPRHD